MRTPAERYLSAEDAARHFAFPSTKAFYAFWRRRRAVFLANRAVLKCGRAVRVDPVAFASVLQDLQAGRA